MKVNLEKTEVMVNSGISKNDMSKSKVDPCGICSLRVKANLVLCVQCGKLIHSRCASEMGDSKLFMKFYMQKILKNIGEAVEQEKMLCYEVESVTEFTYLDDRVSTGERYKYAVSIRTKCGRHMFRECMSHRIAGDFL